MIKECHEEKLLVRIKGKALNAILFIDKEEDLSRAVKKALMKLANRIK
jgi:hypothetical protein